MISAQIALVYLTYLVATVSPGPSNLAIMATAMRDGRFSGLALAAGVITGSMFWAILAATGLSAVLAAYANALFVIKILGGVYLLYLAFRAARSAMRKTSEVTDMMNRRHTQPWTQLYRQGFLMHIGNPKAVLAWIAIMALGLRQDASPGGLPIIIGGCALIGSLVFGGYAVIFSTAPMISLHARLRRWIEGGLSVLFAVAGLKLIFYSR